MAKGHAQGRGDQATLVTSPHTPLAPVSDNVGGASRWPEPTTLCCTWHDRPPPRPAVGTQLPQRLPSPASPAVLASWPMTLPESFSPGAGCAPSAPSLDVALRFRPQHCANTAIPVSARERRPSPFAGSPSPPVLALGAPGLACGPGVLPPCRQQGARGPGSRGGPAMQRPLRGCPRLPLSAVARPAEPQTESLFWGVILLRGAWVL